MIRNFRFRSGLDHGSKCKNHGPIPSRAEGGTDRKHWVLRPQKPLRLIRDGEVGGSGIFLI